MPIFAISISYGTISQTQLITINFTSIWLYNQSSLSECMCQAVRYDSPSIVAFNFFIDNKTCQLIPNDFSVLTSFYLISSINSTVFILKPKFISRLKSICCADISWIMSKIQKLDTFRNGSITYPVGLTFDNDLNKLVTISGTTRRIQQRGLTGNMTGGTSPFVKGNSQPISYHDGFYYVGINSSTFSSPYYFYVYNTSLKVVANMSFTIGYPQRAIWLYNNTLMCLIVQTIRNSSLLFLNWISSLSTYTYNRTISASFNNIYGLTKSNDDTMIYTSGDSATIYQLSLITFTWSILISNENSTEIPMSLFIDSCGHRLWVLMLGFGIRIYDRINGIEIASWNISISYPTLYDMVLTTDYELYLIDNSMDQLIHYGSSLKAQCTIN